MLTAENDEVNGAERFSEETTKAQVAQSQASVDHDNWNAVTECLVALSALEKNQDKLANKVVECATGCARELKIYEDAITGADTLRWIGLKSKVMSGSDRPNSIYTFGGTESIEGRS